MAMGMSSRRQRFRTRRGGSAVRGNDGGGEGEAMAGGTFPAQAGRSRGPGSMCRGGSPCAFGGRGSYGGKGSMEWRNAVLRLREIRECLGGTVGTTNQEIDEPALLNALEVASGLSRLAANVPSEEAWKRLRVLSVMVQLRRYYSVLLRFLQSVLSEGTTVQETNVLGLVVALRPFLQYGLLQGRQGLLGRQARSPLAITASNILNSRIGGASQVCATAEGNPVLGVESGGAKCHDTMLEDRNASRGDEHPLTTSQTAPCSDSWLKKKTSSDDGKVAIGCGTKSGAYVPPHLRGGTGTAKDAALAGSRQSNPERLFTAGGQCPQELEVGIDRVVDASPDGSLTSRVVALSHEEGALFSSDSDLSDNDGGDGDRFKSSKTRVNALFCIQAIARVHPKSLHSCWSILLPTDGVLHSRPQQGTVVANMLFDPVPKVRCAAASVLAAMLDGPARIFLQAAEWKTLARKQQPFTSLSSTLGQIVVQLHTGLQYAIKNETHVPTLTGVLRALSLLVSASPDAPHNVRVRYASHMHNSRPRDAAQALRAAAHNYTSALTPKWDVLQSLISRMIEKRNESRVAVAVDECGNWRGAPPKASDSCGSGDDKSVHAAVKLMDEYLRAVSGYKASDDMSLDEVFVESPRAQDGNNGSSPFPLNVRTPLKVAGGLPGSDDSGARSPEQVGKVDCMPALNHENAIRAWALAANHTLPLAVKDQSPMVRAAALTCYAGMTAAGFESLPSTRQECILSTVLSMACEDSVPAPRSAAFRALGVLVYFRFINESQSRLTAAHQVIGKGISDSSLSVRITAACALANLCNSLRKQEEVLLGRLHGTRELGIEEKSLAEMANSALLAAQDSDKVRSSAVRALGILARFAVFHGDADEPLTETPETSEVPSRWLVQMIQTLVSCVTTGNVKVQWNVCHALGNVFRNKSIRLASMPWALSVYHILLLLLRNSANFKVRIHAAAALAVPQHREDYGGAFGDIMRSLTHALESLDSEEGNQPSDFRYRATLVEQRATFLQDWMLSITEAIMRSDRNRSDDSFHDAEHMDHLPMAQGGVQTYHEQQSVFHHSAKAEPLAAMVHKLGIDDQPLPKLLPSHLYSARQITLISSLSRSPRLRSLVTIEDVRRAAHSLEALYLAGGNSGSKFYNDMLRQYGLLY
ncbi:hypothetical protein CBR_g3175 [Chara braunii]|uniref:DUF4042 domain-containing protein n=1 Tax=Chara braunii TaxID=69332 RepID=A0A388KF01_CHABU|nr:hypothetical protein CBR_g3175 [Chara braunii]|eukprot:GBG68634.1 hypothetical protein CBR_g3175 [Chara braunii]